MTLPEAPGPSAADDEVWTGPDPARARDFAIAAHGFQRYGDRPYAFHLDQVAARVEALGPLYVTVAYLHDVLEDTGVSRADLEREFGPRVARCVATISDPDNRSREERKRSINRQLAAVREGGPDWPALVVKVADRSCNLSMCEVDGRDDLLDRYAREHADFRAAAWRPAFREAFDQMEEVLTRRRAPGSETEGSEARAGASLVERFVADFRRHWESYRQLARESAERCESLLLEQGLQGIVTFRAKSPERLRHKLSRREAARGRPYRDVAEIREDVVDLAGVRIALYFPDDREVLDALISRSFDLVGRKVHAGDRPDMGDYEARFSGYWATHYRVHAPAASPASVVEIQVASVLMHAWSHVAHDLVYKPLAGTLSWSEYALLDQINGLMLAGETALEQLHKAIRARLRRHDAPLTDHFELGAWLTRWTRLAGREDVALGRVDRLFVLLREIERTRPSQIEPLLTLVARTGPIADQLVERILLERPERAQQWQLALTATGSSNPFDLAGLVRPPELPELEGLFAAWAELESAASELLTGKALSSFPIGKKRLAALALSPEDEADFVSARRVYRDVARHQGHFGSEAQREATRQALRLAALMRARAAGSR